MKTVYWVREDTPTGTYYWTNNGYWTQDIMLAERMSLAEATAVANKLRRQGFDARVVF